VRGPGQDNVAAVAVAVVGDAVAADDAVADFLEGTGASSSTVSGM
jgi:hypothetical protein